MRGTQAKTGKIISYFCEKCLTRNENGYIISVEHLNKCSSIHRSNGGMNVNEILYADSDAPVCTEHKHHINENEIKSILPKEENLIDLAELFKIFGDSTRIKILYLLFESEMCVCDIADFLGMTVSAISHQLRILKNAKLVSYRKEGKSVFYSLADEHISSILEKGMEHICE